MALISTAIQQAAQNGLATATAPATQTTTPAQTTNAQTTNNAPPATSTPNNFGIVSPGVTNATPTANNSVQTVAPTQLGTPTQWAIDKNQTVAGQLDNVLAQDSPLMQRARTKANEAMNSRGLLNSSLAVGAGQAAMIDAATPIANADAAVFNKAAGYNADQQNIANTHNMDAQNAAAQFNAGQINNQAALNQTEANKISASNAAAANDMAKSITDNQVRAQIANIQGNYQTLANTSQSAANFQNNMIQQIAGIQTNPNIGAAAKQTAISNLLQLYNQGMQTQSAIANLNLPSLLNFSVR